MSDKAHPTKKNTAEHQPLTMNKRMAQYNVVWDTQSKNSSASMPVGGGDIGLNVWVENGDLLFYVGRAGCRDENGALLKLGRIRVNLDPNPFVDDGWFRQELKLREGCVEIQSGRQETPDVTLCVWVDVHRPVAHVHINSEYDISATATYETWRYEDWILPQGKDPVRAAQHVHDQLRCVPWRRTASPRHHRAGGRWRGVLPSQPER